jgi:hypothetical protein
MKFSFALTTLLLSLEHSEAFTTKSSFALKTTSAYYSTALSSVNNVVLRPTTASNPTTNGNDDETEGKKYAQQVSVSASFRPRRTRSSFSSTRLFSSSSSSSSSNSSNSEGSIPSSNMPFNVNNIVLRPSLPLNGGNYAGGGTSKYDFNKILDSLDVFDSLKIGSPIVHRYKSSTAYDFDSETDSSVNYVMWYQGRSITLDSEEENLLPPLSTGRIGRCVSKNGLVFQKDIKGAIGEDIKGVSLGLNNESWWGFDTSHVGLGSVLLPMTTPAVMTEGGIYLMYYFGGNFEETSIKEYMTTDAGKDISDDLKIKGMKMRIGVAVSQDGETWGRVEGDDPSGACMVPYDIDDTNTLSMADEKDDDGKTPVVLEEELYCGWPEVVVKIDDKNSANSGFYMYYSTMSKTTKEKSIAVAVSSDGFRWFKRGLCLQPSLTDDDSPSNSLDDGGCARCNVVRNASYNKVDESWSDEPGYIMFYEGVSLADNKHRILSATSPDGRTWTKSSESIAVLDIGNIDTWDCDGVGSPHILR